MRDGDEKRVEARLVFTYTESDHSVGINGGFNLTGIEVGDEFITIDEFTYVPTYMPMGDERIRTYRVEPSDARILDRLAEGLSESVLDIEPDLSDPDPHEGD